MKRKKNELEALFGRTTGERGMKHEVGLSKPARQLDFHQFGSTLLQVFCGIVVGGSLLCLCLHCAVMDFQAG